MHALQGSHMQTSLSISVLLMVAVGGSLGAVLRYLVTLWSIQKFGDGFPWGTLLVNIVGAFFVGLMIALLQDGHCLIRIGGLWLLWVRLGV